MSKHILFNALNVLSARYDSEIHGDNIPTAAKEVSERLFYQTIDEQDGIWSLVGDAVIKQPFTAPTIASLITAKRAEINATFEREMQQVINGYPSNEVSSWSKQETEARAYAASNSATTPLIDALSSARGLAKSELVARVIAKADIFATVSGQLIGKRQALEDALDALPETATSEDVATIVW